MPATAAATRRRAMSATAPPPLAVRPRRSRRKALPADVPELSDARRSYAQCRVLGHAWQHIGADTAAARFGTYGFVSQCSCGTQRVKTIAASGRTVKARYKYPSEYQQRGEDALSAQQWRRVLIVSMGYE